VKGTYESFNLLSIESGLRKRFITMKQFFVQSHPVLPLPKYFILVLYKKERECVMKRIV